MVKFRFLLALWLVLAPLSLCLAAADVYDFDSPEQEDRFMQLTEELRCLVCQNQSLAGSGAELAGDLRREVYEMVRSGKPNEEIVSFLVARYGDFVLYRPPVRKETALLWFGPFVAVLVAAFLLFRYIRRRKRSSEPEFSDADRAKVADVLTQVEQQRDKAQ